MLAESFEVQLSSRLFPLQTSPGFLLKAKHLLVTLCLSETCRPCYEYFESSEMNRALNPFSLGCLPLSCPACVPYVKWFCGVGGSVYLPVHISLYVYGGDKGQEMNNYNQWVQLSRLFSYLLWFFSFYYCAWNLKSSSECRRALAWVLRNSFRFGWELSCWKVLMEAVFVLLLIIISFPLTRDR